MALVLQPEIMLKLPRAESSSVRGRGINVVPQLTFQLQDMQGIRFLSGPGRRDLVWTCNRIWKSLHQICEITFLEWYQIRSLVTVRFFLPFPTVIDPLIIPVVDTKNRTYQICCPILMPQAGCVFSVDQTLERWNLRSFEIPKYGYILPFKTLWSMKWLFEGETSVWNNEGLGSWGTHVSCWSARFRCGLGRRLGWKGGVRFVRQLVWGFVG